MRRRPTVSKKMAEQDGAEQIAQGERQDVGADAAAGDVVGLGQHQAVGEEHRVEQEGLGHHQGKHKDGAGAVFAEHGFENNAETEHFARVGR